MSDDSVVLARRRAGCTYPRLLPQEAGCEAGGWQEGIERHRPWIQSGWRYVDAPAADEPHKKPYDRFHCWSDNSAFDMISSKLTESDPTEPPDPIEPEVLMIDATDVKAHRTASSPNKGS